METDPILIADTDPALLRDLSFISNPAGVPHLEGWGESREPSVARLVLGWPSMKLHRQAHVVSKTQYHLGWVTRYRRNILVPGIAE